MVESRWATTKLVRPSIRVSKACWIWTSVRVSMLEVASSRISMGGRHSITRAMQRSWRWPWLRLSSVRTVSRPWGRRWMKFQLWAALAARMISSSVASGRPKAMFSRTVPRLIQVSCSTMPKLPRRAWRERAVVGTPSTAMLPPLRS